MTFSEREEQRIRALIGRVEELERKQDAYLTSVALSTNDIKFPGKGKYNGLDDFINNTMSSGLISGCTVTDNNDGTVAISSGYGYIRKTSDDIGELLAFNIPANSSVNLTDDVLNYVYVDYNSGNPTFSYTADVTSLDHTSQFVIALVYQESDHAHISHAVQRLNNFIHDLYYHSWEIDGRERASGGVPGDVSDDGPGDRTQDADLRAAGANRHVVAGAVPERLSERGPRRRSAPSGGTLEAGRAVPLGAHRRVGQHLGAHRGHHEGRGRPRRAGRLGQTGRDRAAGLRPAGPL